MHKFKTQISRLSRKKQQKKKSIKYLGVIFIILAALIIGTVLWFTQRDSQNSEAVCDLGDGVVIWSVSGYTGSFVEDGSDREVENVIQLRVENTSEEDIQFLRIRAEQGENTAYFDITTLPAGSAVDVQESSGEEYAGWMEKCTYSIENLAYFREDRSLYPDLFRVTAGDGVISVENHSSQDITNDVYVYFKNMDDDIFAGGITYRVKFSGGIPSGETVQEQSIHYRSDNSRIMYVTYQ